MKLTVKLVSVLVLLLLASPVALLKGCGDAVNGGQCGGCPDSTAPFGSTISGVASLANFPASTGGCYPTVSFTVLDSDGKPLNNICVELFTDGASAIAKHSGLPNCSGVIASASTSMITRTNDSGVVVVEFAVPGGVLAGETFFVQATSCGISSSPTIANAE